jgi:hypothetical protein
MGNRQLGSYEHLRNRHRHKLANTYTKPFTNTNHNTNNHSNAIGFIFT